MSPPVFAFNDGYKESSGLNKRGVHCNNLLMSFNVPFHRVTVLVGDPTRGTARTMKRTPKCRYARDPLHDGVPGDTGSGRDNGWIWGIHNHQITAVGLIYEVGYAESTEYPPGSGHMSPTFRSIPVVETLVKWTESMELESSSQSSRHSS